MSRVRSLVVAVGMLALTGCADFFKGLGAEERESEDLSLIFGTIRLEFAWSIDEIALERVAPLPRRSMVISTAAKFRLFRPKLIHRGAFVVPNVPPGVYRLAWVRQGLNTWTAPDDSDLMRLEVTEPGVYDAGSFVVHGENRMDQERQPDHASRYSELVAATAGTKWEAAARRLAQQMTGE